MTRLAPSTRVRLSGRIGFATLDPDGTYSVRAPGGETVRCVPREAMTEEELTVETLTTQEIEALLAIATDTSTAAGRMLRLDCRDALDPHARGSATGNRARARIVAHLTAKPAVAS